MVDVGDKDVTRRIAVAEGWIRMRPATLERIVAGAHAKGDVLGVARIAGIMAAKRTADLIPLCHPLALDPGGGGFGAASRIKTPSVARRPWKPTAAPASKWKP